MITTFVGQEATGRQGAGRKLPSVAVRSFLRFLVFRGAIRAGFEAAALAYHLKNSGLKAHALTGCHDEGTLA